MQNKQWIFVVLFITTVFIGCKNNTTTTSDETVPVTADTLSALDQIIESESTPPHYTTDATGKTVIINERFGFTFELPEQFKATDKSNNGDGYFITTGDAGTDLRIYGSNLKGNELEAELELSTCEKTEPFRFGNGYPGTLCFQSGDKYYYYDTPNTRVIFYVHATKLWQERNAAIIEQIAKSIVVGEQGF
jgi:superoxide dismutase